ncbi:hypothetical protein [Synechococcus sp. GFB01]|uniref:hypothetical protein n=1 Tax=Synechococcus sp. GFB01 TaxID=1662190 RepID=UPI001F292BFF|nr:hypothetical protein [Synechococcus sp. GFB01]
MPAYSLSQLLAQSAPGLGRYSLFNLLGAVKTLKLLHISPEGQWLISSIWTGSSLELNTSAMGYNSFLDHFED